jgi:ketosteroid isomerase-like protein
MAVTFTIEVNEGAGTREQLEDVRRRVGAMDDASMPPGMLAHVESERPGGGFRIVDVWESPEDFERFFTGALGAAFEATGFQPMEGPPAVEQVMNLLLRQRASSEQAAANEALLRRGYEAFAHGDIPTVLDLMDEHILWYSPDSVRFGGTYAGKEGVQQFFSHLPENFSDLSVEPTTFVSAGDHVIVQGRLRGQTQARTPFELAFLHSWTISGGRAVAFTEFYDTARMNAALGMPVQTASSTS